MYMIVPLFISSGYRAVAVLTPQERNLIWKELSVDYRIRGDFLLQTAMRLSEAYEVTKQPGYYRRDNHAIFLPFSHKLGKKRCTIKNRSIMLSPKGVDAVEAYIKYNVGLPSYQSMEESFKRAARNAGFDDKYITTKMLRKTMISWLMTCYPERQMQIAFSAGHDYATMQGHYLMYGWRKDDIRDMREETAGWGDA
jgi:integrase